jgi:nucleotide-binding universal stress UspA family protein
MSTRVEELFAESSFAAPDRIVVATALTDLEYLAPAAIAQAQMADAELIFVHAVVEDELPVRATYYNPLKADRDARLTLEVLARHIRARGLSCTTVVRHGTVRDVIDEVVQEQGAGRLVAGTCSHALEPNGRLGRTARQIMAHQWIPVSCARPGRSDRPGGNDAPRRILYPVVGELEHGHLVHDLAKYLHAELLLMHEGREEQVAARVNGHCAVDCPLGLKPRSRRIAAHRIDAKLIAETAHANEADMIVLDGPALFDPEQMFCLLEELLERYDGEVLVAQSLLPKRDAASWSSLHVISSTVI